MASVLSVREMIDVALGSSCEENMVNFKMLQNVLHVLAQQLRVHERKVELRDEGSSSSIVNVTEVKVEAPKVSKGLAKDTMLIVERGSATEIDKSRDRYHGRVSVVTQAQFAQLEDLVHNSLKQKNLLPRFNSVIPPNNQAIADMRSGNLSLPDAMTTMQIAARVDATERGIEKLAELITELAATSGFQMRNDLERKESTSTTLVGKTFENSEKVKVSSEEAPKETDMTEIYPTINMRRKSVLHPQGANLVLPDTEGLVTEDELVLATKELQTEIHKTVTMAEQRIKTSVDIAIDKIRGLEGMLSKLIGVDERISAVENNIGEYSTQLNSLDAGLSSQISSFQEQLNELQADLEAGLQQAVESAAAGGDMAAMNELNTKVSNLTTDFEQANASLEVLDNDIKKLVGDLHALLEEIELLKENKVDIEAMMDSLRDKADKRALNGMVAVSYFEAVRESIEDKQKAAIDKFSKCELVWQNAIDELHVELDEKAEKNQLEPLRDYLDGRLVDLLRRIQELVKVVGEPRAAAVTRRWIRDTECIACSAPAVLQEECTTLPRLPAATAHGVRPPTIGAENTDENKFVCHAEWPTGVHLCRRYCGGSHTMLPADVVTRSQFPEELKVSPASRRVAAGEGTDGRLYRTEEMVAKRPCIPCNPPPPQTSRDTIKAAVSTGASGCACWTEVSGPRTDPALTEIPTA